MDKVLMLTYSGLDRSVNPPAVVLCDEVSEHDVFQAWLR